MANVNLLHETLHEKPVSEYLDQSVNTMVVKNDLQYVKGAKIYLII